MKIEDIREYMRSAYCAECSGCGKLHTILTQPDDGPEYTTEVYVRCDCGGYVLFVLPVN